MASIVGMDEAKREKARQAARRWRERNREKHRAYARAWSAANPEKRRATELRRRARMAEKDAAKRAARAAERAERREANREARLEAKRAAGRARYQHTKERDRERRLARSRAFRAAHPGYLRRWRAANPEKRRAWRKVRRANRGKKIREYFGKLQRGRCAICREKLGSETHIDHIMPLALGGQNRRSNLQLTCAPCNLSKGAVHPVEFAQSLGRLI